MIANKKSILLTVTLMDFFCINFSYIAAAIITRAPELTHEGDYTFLLIIIQNFTWFFYSSSTGFYQDFLTRPFPIQFFNIFKVATLISIVSILFFFVIKQPLYTRYFIVVNGFLILLTIFTRTIVSKVALRILRSKGKSIRNLLIIGSEEIGEKFRDVIMNNPEYGHRFIGFIDNSSNKDVIGNLNELDTIINKNKIEDVVIAINNKSEFNLAEIVKVCNRNAVKIHVIPDYFKFLSGRFQLSTVSNLPVITIRDEPLNEVIRRFVKRVFDILFSFLIILFVLSWVLPIVSLLIILDSKGPALFIQERIGMRRKAFKCIKFRTLSHQKISSEKMELVVKEDPRITRIGRILRKTNLDELPQFINVLKGDMSVVGPRPHPFGFERAYELVFEEIKMRYTVRPGVTGWAQINGLRGDVMDEEENRRRILERMKFDLWYIENWSIKLDIQIILLTIWHMIRGETKGF